jgi:hypothetical protein
MGQEMGALLGGAGTPGTSAAGIAEQSQPGFVGPPAQLKQDPSGIMGALSAGFAKIQDFSQFLGDDPKERELNAKKFAALIKDVGSAATNIKDSTLMRRMIEMQMRQAARTPLAMTGGTGGQALSPIPRSFDPGSAASAGAWRGF